LPLLLAHHQYWILPTYYRLLIQKPTMLKPKEREHPQISWWFWIVFSVKHISPRPRSVLNLANSWVWALALYRSGSKISARPCVLVDDKLLNHHHTTFLPFLLLDLHLPIFISINNSHLILIIISLYLLYVFCLLKVLLCHIQVQIQSTTCLIETTEYNIHLSFISLSLSLFIQHDNNFNININNSNKKRK
jgi:hypothetical protein